MNSTPVRAEPVEAPLICHVVYRFAVGGLENGVVNLINHLPANRWRHAVVSLTDIDPSFAARIRTPGVALHALHKPPGQGFRQWPALARLFRQLGPAIVHTRNLAALEAQLPAWWAGVPGRVHGEHGRDVEDPDGTSRKHQWMRKAYRPFVQHTIALGRELADYSLQRIGIPPERLYTLYNGVDASRFHPTPDGRRASLAGSPFNDPALWLVGTVGRMQTVKAQPVLARAFVQVLQQQPALRDRLRLVLVGDGQLRAECEAVLADAGLSKFAWFAGERSDVADVMRCLDCFVLPSLAEGISNTILEAMASGLPVVATSVGANTELVVEGLTGHLISPGDADALAAVLQRLALSPQDKLRCMGQCGRRRVEQHFCLDTMVRSYESVYFRALRLGGHDAQR
ncbi:MAG: TIGR03088 family PEP-CTERM/XrtA system glycosyltransferase [Betaproteobacteria bacterium]|nr:TIGR03088 family PEP-CTERM/XrtA system glycosyltransferase [Rubrivivax sp.]MCZ8174300.1 TIGR03088 family PEP-CTERM/XrtA system glycosyltransferase [Burkholderiaceae bacterium]